MNDQAHETAIVDAGAEIGTGTRIWHWVHVCGGASIGEDCSLGQTFFSAIVSLIRKNESS